MECHIVDAPEALAGLETRWRTLWNLDPGATIFQSFDWTRLWLEHYATYVDSLLVMVCEVDGRCVGIAPFYVRKRSLLRMRSPTLMFIGTGEDEAEETFAEYLAPLCIPSLRDACISRFAEALRAQRGVKDFDFQRMRFSGENSIARQLAPHAESRSSGICFSMPAGSAEALAALGGRQRGTLARKLRRLRKEPGYRVDVAGDEIARREIFSDLQRLHVERWRRVGKPGVFSNERFTRFHEELTRDLLKDDRLILLRVCARGSPLAVVYATCDHGAGRYYQGGVDLALLPELSPGLLAHFLVSDEVQRRGLPAYDLMLSGSEASYKSRIAAPGERLWDCRSRVRR